MQHTRVRAHKRTRTFTDTDTRANRWIWFCSWEKKTADFCLCFFDETERRAVRSWMSVTCAVTQCSKRFRTERVPRTCVIEKHFFSLQIADSRLWRRIFSSLPESQWIPLIFSELDAIKKSIAAKVENWINFKRQMDRFWYFNHKKNVHFSFFSRVVWCVQL